MYTIKLLRGGLDKRDQVIKALTERLEKSRFTATLTPSTTRDRAGEYPAILVKPVRLRQAKPYCGQHAGECQINPFTGPRRKPNAKYLEFEDWVAFHGVVNAVLNRLRVHADVWSDPLETRGRMWIRKDTKARVRYDYDTDYDMYGRAVHTWNLGTDDQFAPTKLQGVM
jgi:hypothetical protein